MKENEDIEEAIVTVHKMTEDEKMRRLADLREKAIMDGKAIRRKGYEDGHGAGYEDGMAKGIKKGMDEGIVKGIKESQKNIAKKLKDKGMSIEEIQQITELTAEEIKML